MDSPHEEKSGSKKSCLVVILGIFAFFLIAVLLGYCFWPHLLWKYSERKFGPSLTAKLKKIPNSPMPEVDVPEDWVEHTLGDLRFRLPPDLPFERSRVPDADTADPKTDHSFSVFRNENIRVGVSQLPMNFKEVVKATVEVHPARKKFSTLTQLRLDASGTAANDFRWSMSRKDAAWHGFIVSLRVLLVRLDTERMESFAGGNCEGLLLFVKSLNDDGTTEKEYQHFEWECASCFMSGNIHFRPEKEGEQFDVDVARKIIHSLEIDCGCPPRTP